MREAVKRDIAIILSLLYVNSLLFRNSCRGRTCSVRSSAPRSNSTSKTTRSVRRHSSRSSSASPECSVRLRKSNRRVAAVGVVRAARAVRRRVNRLLSVVRVVVVVVTSIQSLLGPWSCGDALQKLWLWFVRASLDVCRYMTCFNYYVLSCSVIFVCFSQIEWEIIDQSIWTEHGKEETQVQRDY